ncbi:NADPH-dependent F420 reductase [Arthrobacter glacialis]|uniref:NADPH-dependent F420 reductase n=1 Tax=Arthrobacter glacialis TaxID=1664 RepID=UPI000CD46CB3|nr:NAD(P)-binding domain-containing protein [Arthrobacter glacialis]POH60319.1 NADP oxidoreductase [Arthrobacter glacialis]
MTTLGIIGSGNIGAAIARLAVAGEIPVVISNSRGPESLAKLVSELGPFATAGTIEQSANQDLVVLSIPLAAHPSIPVELLQGKTVLDTSNYYPSRDGRIAELDDHSLTTSELIQQRFQGVHLVKAFNNILAHHIPQLARPADAPDRSTLPIASNYPQAATEAASLIARLGFDALDTGAFADSWRFEPDSAAYTRIYLADPSTPDQDLMEAPAAPVTEEKLRSALTHGTRVDVAKRAF